MPVKKHDLFTPFNRSGDRPLPRMKFPSENYMGKKQLSIFFLAIT